MRFKVKETTVSFVDNFLAQNDQNSIEMNSSLYLGDTINYKEFVSNLETQSDFKENNFVNTKLLEFESKNFNENFIKKFGKFASQVKPNADNVHLIRHKF